jgi:hypothetical protein
MERRQVRQKPLLPQATFEDIVIGGRIDSLALNATAMTWLAFVARTQSLLGPTDVPWIFASDPAASGGMSIRWTSPQLERDKRRNQMFINVGRASFLILLRM